MFACLGQSIECRFLICRRYETSISAHLLTRLCDLAIDSENFKNLNLTKIKSFPTNSTLSNRFWFWVDSVCLFVCLMVCVLQPTPFVVHSTNQRFAVRSKYVCVCARACVCALTNTNAPLLSIWQFQNPVLLRCSDQLCPAGSAAGLQRHVEVVTCGRQVFFLCVCGFVLNGSGSFLFLFSHQHDLPRLVCKVVF